ncbi:putative lipoprotein [Leptospira fainei serovar Hurstbridge str. BUT 6]|uniref:Lipoprotein n=2 Tax=Leptospira fainei TaxID=48782 RepID=S3UYA9_9LEPT|nr:putative lipoprotein [Leptospira fainei serovar Hurstbridge str. BUT 6]
MKQWKTVPVLLFLLSGVLLGSCKKSSSDDTAQNLTLYQLLGIGQCGLVISGVTKFVPPVALTKGQSGTATFIALNSSWYVSAITITVSVSDQVTVTIPAADNLSYSAYVGGCPVNTNSGTTTSSTQFTGGVSGLNGTATTTFTTQVAGKYTIYFTGNPPTNPAVTVSIQ